MSKIKVGLIFQNRETAVDFKNKHFSNAVVNREFKNHVIYENSIMIFHWIKPFKTLCGLRLNFVFTTQDVKNTDWFNTVISPMVITETAIVD